MSFLFSQPPRRRPRRSLLLRLMIIAVLGALVCSWVVHALINPPAAFPQQYTFEVRDGEDLGSVAYQLQQAGVIRSAQAFKLVMLVLGNEQHLSVGSYYFDKPITSIEVALKFSGKSFGILQHKVTFPEGFTNAEIGARMAAQFPGFDAPAFLTLAKSNQGYLFPDTYSFDPDVAPQSVLDTLSRTFNDKTAPLDPDFETSVRTKHDVVIMASILEKEAANAQEMPVIAGILWKRIDRGIPLQVDAPLALMLDKTSAELTTADLASKSPYNTYTHTGLPPLPIDNPGLAAITAALHPTSSPYLYYLHDPQGNVHYASTFDEHKANKQKYLP